MGYSTSVGWVASVALMWAACSGKTVVEEGGSTTSTSSSTSTSGSPGSCEDRIQQVLCYSEPPACPAGTFPGVDGDGSCWSGQCLDCVDGCQLDDDCVVVRACGCAYHEGCSWAETSYRAALLDPCIVTVGQTCAVDCDPSFCTSDNCPWCDADATECVDGVCQPIITHMCE